MPYVGKSPVIGNFVKLDAISVVNGQAAYTMQNGGSNFTAYNNVNQFLVSLNGILQAPTDSFTVSGSTITFASNLVTGDVIDFIIVLGNTLDVGVPSDNTVSLAKLTATGTKDATTFLRGDNTFSTLPDSGITEQDIFVLTSGSAISAATATVLSGMTRTDDNGFEKIGTGMSESSGTFIFPSTGYYKIDFIAGLYDNAANRSVEARIYVTTDNSTYNQAALGRANIYNAGANCYASPYCFFVFKVTDTSTHKVQLYVYGDQAFTVFGNTTQLITYAGFTKLKDI
jgi:hypothetical protein